MPAPLSLLGLPGRTGTILRADLPVTKPDATHPPRREDQPCQADLPDDSVSLALACAIAQALKTGTKPLIHGLGEEPFQRLMKTFFPHIRLQNFAADTAPVNNADEYDDLVALLLAHRKHPTVTLEWLCHIIASASLRDNHLWQDMGLPNRKALSQLMQECFPMLAAKNTHDMKWKKFFYRQLCEQEEILICKSPNCADCCDYALCFDPKEA